MPVLGRNPLVHAVVASGANLAADLAKRIYPNRDFDLPNRTGTGLIALSSVKASNERQR
jgi:hypothetical protein